MDNQWFGSTKEGVVNFSSHSIILNSDLKDHFIDAYLALIGIDKANNVLLIKGLKKEEALITKYSDSELHPIAIKKKCAKINGKNLVRNISKYITLDFSKKPSYNFIGIWEKANNILKIYLDKEA